MPSAAAKARKAAKERERYAKTKHSEAAADGQAKLKAEIERMRSPEYFMEQLAAMGGDIKRHST